MVFPRTVRKPWPSHVRRTEASNSPGRDGRKVKSSARWGESARDQPSLIDQRVVAGYLAILAETRRYHRAHREPPGQQNGATAAGRGQRHGHRDGLYGLVPCGANTLRATSPDSWGTAARDATRGVPSGGHSNHFSARGDTHLDPRSEQVRKVRRRVRAVVRRPTLFSRVGGTDRAALQRMTVFPGNSG